eukprot:2800164-Rhodomonas_salina.1
MRSHLAHLLFLLMHGFKRFHILFPFLLNFCPIIFLLALRGGAPYAVPVIICRMPLGWRCLQQELFCMLRAILIFCLICVLLLPTPYCSRSCSARHFADQLESVDA